MLQTTALINEAYVRLMSWKKVSWRNRAHFFAVSAKLMRHILVDFARRRPRLERGGEARQVSLDEALGGTWGSEPGLGGHRTMHWRPWLLLMRGKAKLWSCGSLAG